MPSVARPTFFFRWAPLIKILDPPLTSYQKKEKKKIQLGLDPHNWPGPRGTSPPAPLPPPLSTPLPMAAGVEVNHHDIRLEDLCCALTNHRVTRRLVSGAEISGQNLRGEPCFILNCRPLYSTWECPPYFLAHLTKPAPTQCPFLSDRPLKIYQRPLVGGTAQVEDH